MKYWILCEIRRLDRARSSQKWMRHLDRQVRMRIPFRIFCKTEDQLTEMTRTLANFFRQERLSRFDKNQVNDRFTKNRKGGKSTVPRTSDAPMKNILKMKCYLDFRDEKALAQSRLRYSKIFSLFKRASCFPSSYALLTPIGSV